MAGSTLALSLSHLANLILTINLLILGPAFVLYFLTLTLLYFRSKFYDLSETKIAPTFNIVLAPAGVSIIALIMTSQAMLKYKFLHLASLFSDLTKLYSLVMFGYGLWIVGALLYLYWRIIREKEKIPFSQLWWAFIFPLAAFTLATFNLYHFVLSFEAIKFIYYTLYFILLAIWLLVVYKTFFKHFLNLLLKKSS
jgi:tellurite resistance protein TehA-like permease